MSCNEKMIEYLSKEIETLTTNIMLFRSRIAFSIWVGPYVLLGSIIEIPLKTGDEARFLVIGKIAEKHWSAIITYRSEKARLISVRRSRKEEVDIYEG